MPPAKRLSLIAARLAIAQGDRSLRQIAKEAGVSPSAVELIANGKRTNPGVLTIEKIAKALGVDPKWLAYGD